MSLYPLPRKKQQQQGINRDQTRVGIPTPAFMYTHAYYYFSNILMIYFQTSICIYVIIRLQQEASARSGNDKLRASDFTSDDDLPLAAKKIIEPFDIRFPNLPRPVVEVRPRIQVELPITYQAHPPPQTCRDILRVMSVQKNSEDD